MSNFIFDTAVFSVYGEDDTGFQMTALAWKPGMGVCPKLGVEDYRYSVAQRISRTRGKGPFARSERVPTAAELAALHTAVREHLAAIDRGEIEV